MPTDLDVLERLLCELLERDFSEMKTMHDAFAFLDNRIFPLMEQCREQQLLIDAFRKITPRAKWPKRSQLVDQLQ